MSTQNETTQPSNGASRRRSSFSPGSSLSDYFSSSRQPQATPAYPGPIASAAVQASQRRMSVSSANGTSPPQLGFGARRGSVSSVSSSTSAADDNALDDTEGGNASPHSPFARRMSWGARAFREVRIPTVGPKTSGASSPTITRGFWLDSGRNPSEPSAPQQRRQSVSTLPAPATAMPAPKDPMTVDPLQERMLKGELYMD